MQNITTESRSTQPVSFINFHGLNLLVARFNGIDYVEARPLCELAGIQWKGAKRALERGDNARLYDIQRLLPPQFAGFRTLKWPEDAVLHLRLDRARMYLARISTDRMRVNGNGNAADEVLALQIEWAQVLHAYETHGVAAKTGRSNGLKDLHQLARTRTLLTDPRERSAFTLLLHKELKEIGLPLDTFDDPQQELALRHTKPTMQGINHD